MNFEYRAYDKTGATVADHIEAAETGEAVETLRRRGLYVVEIAESKGRRAAIASDGAPPGKRVGSGERLKLITAFTRQLAVLVSTGTPLVDAIASLERQTKPGAWREVLADIRQRVEEGSQLSEALERHRGYFDTVCRSLIAAGETGGKLDAMLDRLSKLTRQQQKIRSQVIGALVYPALLIGVSVAVVILMLTFVMPRFEGLFKSLGAKLPPMTALLISTGHAVRAYWWAWLGGAAALALALRAWLASRAGREWSDTVVLRLPQIGPLVRAFATARIARVMGVLIEGRVAMLDAIHLTRQSMHNSRYIALLTKAEQAVTKGDSVSTVFATTDGGTPLITPAVYEAIRAGERTGRVGPVLVSIAESMDEDNEVIVKALTSVLEPVILIVLGLIVGGLATSMFLPLFDLTAAAGGGGR